ncbi:MAG TPA: TIGR00303 family protein [Candidatus Obscuribacterales bacterium]
MKAEFLVPVHDSRLRLVRFLAVLETLRMRGRPVCGRFVLALGSTETSDVPGVSAAGATPEMRRLTPAVDAEVLMLGRPVSAQTIPVSPIGIVSPVVITRAALQFLTCRPLVIDCGSFHPPRVASVTLAASPARCVSSGEALPLAHVQFLFGKGLELGRCLAAENDYLVLAECVPGGTTTALGVLTALGYKVDGLLSSSLPEADHALRAGLVRRGLKRAGSLTRSRLEPLEAVAACGDPMQPVVSGMALAAAARIPVILAGGSQMLAVWALMNALAGHTGMEASHLSAAVITTKWVAFDRSAALPRLAARLQAPLAAACPEFRRSRHQGLRAYEDGHVKEGVGAGGTLAAAHLIGAAAPEDLMAAIDAMYDELVAVTAVN